MGKRGGGQSTVGRTGGHCDAANICAVEGRRRKLSIQQHLQDAVPLHQCHGAICVVNRVTVHECSLESVGVFVCCNWNWSNHDNCQLRQQRRHFRKYWNNRRWQRRKLCCDEWRGIHRDSTQELEEHGLLFDSAAFECDRANCNIASSAGNHRSIIHFKFSSYLQRDSGECQCHQW